MVGNIKTSFSSRYFCLITRLKYVVGGRQKCDYVIYERNDPFKNIKKRKKEKGIKLMTSNKDYLTYLIYLF